MRRRFENFLARPSGLEENVSDGPNHNLQNEKQSSSRPPLTKEIKEYIIHEPCNIRDMSHVPYPPKYRRRPLHSFASPVNQ